MRKFLKTPKGSVMVTLVILMLIAALHPSDRAGLHTILLCALTAVVIDFVVALFHKPRRLFSDGGIVTGLIIGLVLGTTTHWYIPVAITAISVVSKHVLKVGRKPILNPAALGLLIGIYVFHTGQSWWGDLADLPGLMVIVLLAAGYFVVSRVNKFPQVFTFLGTYFILLLAAGYYHIGQVAYTPGDALRDPIVNAALFMAFFMLTDPPTSPAKYRGQVAFGLIVAVVSVAIYLAVGGLSYLLIGLLVGNVWKARQARKVDTRVKAEKGKHAKQPNQARNRLNKDTLTGV